MWLEKQSFISFTWQTATKVISGGILSKIFLQTFLSNFTWKIKRLWKLDFSKFSGDPCISKPNRVHRHRWLTDPFTLGTWSYPSINSSFKVLYALHLNLELSILEGTILYTWTWSYPSLKVLYSTLEPGAFHPWRYYTLHLNLELYILEGTILYTWTWSYTSLKVLYTLHLNLELSILEGTIYSTLEPGAFHPWRYYTLHLNLELSILEGTVYSTLEPGAIHPWRYCILYTWTWSYPSFHSFFKVLYALHLNLELSILECTVYSTLGTWSYPSFHSSFRALYIYINSTYTKDKIINFSERLDFSS